MVCSSWYLLLFGPYNSELIVLMALATSCACRTCICEVQISQAVVLDGQSFFQRLVPLVTPIISCAMAVAHGAALAWSEVVG